MAKQIILLLILFLPLTGLFAQNYLNESCAWYEFSGDAFDGNLTIAKYEITGDTTFNSKLYWKVDGRLDLYFWNIFGNGDTTVMHDFIAHEYIREENGAFYRWQFNGDEFIVDFNLALGDTIHPPGGGYMQIVTGVETFEVAGETRKKFITNFGNEVYEGIGTNQGLFEGLSFIGDEGYGYIKCFSKDGDVVELSNETLGFSQIEPCDSVMMTDAKEFSFNNAALILFPNPVHNSFVVQCPFPVNHPKLTLFDTNGRNHELSSTSIDSNKLSCRIEPNIVSGIYLLFIEENGIRFWSRFILE